jgi:CBS domain-containing protein
MLCRDVMKPTATTCLRIASVSQCARTMAEHDIGLLPVVSGEGSLVGVVTDRDLALRVLAQDRSPQIPVSEVMTRGIVTCGPDDSLDVAEERLRATKKSRIVVIDSKHHVLGVIGLSDIARSEDSARAGPILRSVTARGSGVVGVAK